MNNFGVTDDHMNGRLVSQALGLPIALALSVWMVSHGISVILMRPLKNMSNMEKPQTGAVNANFA